VKPNLLTESYHRFYVVTARDTNVMEFQTLIVPGNQDGRLLFQDFTPLRSTHNTE